LKKASRHRERATENRRSGSKEPACDGGPDEAAVFIAETAAELARLARGHRFEMLDFLLRMVQLEAEERLRLRSKHKLS
jgi:hypothetical protein